jgi:diguanylate cyclase (GGDEF)-like protein
VTTILIIDDSGTHRAETRRALDGIVSPMRVIEAEDGMQGLKLLMSESVDLVVCDLEMPKLDGEKLLRMREMSPGGAHTPFLFLSASASLERKTRLLHDGASDVMDKPFHVPELVARVKLHLKVKQLQDELMLKNATLERLSTVDCLTGLRTRRYVEEMLQIEFLRARRYRTPLSVTMMDIDHFKQVNDVHGHMTGDAVLRQVGEIVRETLRRSDVAGRYGGEEIVLVMPHNDARGAAVLAERIRATLASTAFPGPQGEPIQVTASFGIAEHDPALGSAAELVQRADEALYAAKKGGRNRVQER